MYDTTTDLNVEAGMRTQLPSIKLDLQKCAQSFFLLHFVCFGKYVFQNLLCKIICNYFVVGNFR